MASVTLGEVPDVEGEVGEEAVGPVTGEDGASVEDVAPASVSRFMASVAVGLAAGGSVEGRGKMVTGSLVAVREGGGGISVTTR